MSYTIKNLADVTDMAPQFGFGEIQESRFPARDLNAERTGFALMRIKPGKRSVVHRHSEAEEIYVILSGSGRVKLDDDVVEVKERDAIRVAPQVARGWEAGPNGLEYLAFGQRHEGDGEFLDIEEFWGS
jgi:quercetin dioxygenase-like cupin family protein